MADVQTFCRSVGENAKTFNDRVRRYCARHPVTNFELHVVDGMPMLVLMMEEVQATEVDVAKARQIWEEECEEAKAAKEELPEEPDLEVGEWIPAGDPLIVEVARVSCLTKDEAGKSEERLNLIYQRADGNVMRHTTAHGRTIAWVEDSNVAAQIARVRAQNLTIKDQSAKVPEPEMKYVQSEVQASFCAVGYLNQDELEDDEEGDGEGDGAPEAPTGGRRNRVPVGAGT